MYRIITRRLGKVESVQTIKAPTALQAISKVEVQFKSYAINGTGWCWSGYEFEARRVK